MVLISILLAITGCILGIIGLYLIYGDKLNYLSKQSYEYGWCQTFHARRNKITGEIQFLLWKPGEQGWAKGMWHTLGAGREQDFFTWDDGNQLANRQMITSYSPDVH